MNSCKSCLSKEKCNSKSKRSVQTYGREGEPDSLPEITSAFLVVTQACNLKCKYCFVVQKPRSMTLKTAKDAADYLATNAKERGEIPSINFFGGEPLLKWKDVIVPLTYYIRQKYGDNFELSMTTNGVLLDEEKLQFMKKNKIGFMVSIDGNKKTQDINRPCADGRSSFDIIAPKIAMFLRYNPNMTFRATVDHDNVEEYLNNHKFAVEHGYTNMFSIVNVFSKWSEPEKNELEKQIHLTAEYYLDLLYEGKNFSMSPFESMFRKIDKIKEAERKNEFRTAGKGLLAYGRCGLGASKFASIGTDGTLYSCQEMSDNDEIGREFIIGDIYKGTNKNRRMNIIKKFDPKKVHSTDDMDCKKCPFYRICDGACTINNYFANGDLNIMPSILCFYYQCLYREAVQIRKTAEQFENVVERFRNKGILKRK
ncbi:anaerobic sulfatase-maturating enzyme [Clostridium tepidiprofundi DSM 19306]|uniref:Anaerobic sulfatase-maturating enzyme n=1 Tax=Clostridium tepidiprofundi DSM 19306 TaxID=1121338 RepID=A0A151B0H4_9CLOT|nr:radical SAM protein [Clostridium tepidiprofundi]KYH33282.1 anaerobic sulfatase-maturating enzyme [Clostridium tepidiprofundi DSM 19306]